MSRARKLLIGGAFLVVLALAVGLVALDRATEGVPGFYLWRATSGQFHGSHRASINGVRIYYETYGSGPPVLLLHPAATFFETMHYFISGLAPSHLVIAVDSRGQGRSTDSSAPLTYAQMGDDMIKLIDTLHLKRVDVVGWSDGGIIGLDMAMKHPDRVRRLIAIGANYDVSGIDPKNLPPGMEAEIVREIGPFYNVMAPDPSHLPVMAKKVVQMGRTEPHYTIEALSHIQARTAIVVGENDLILPAHTESLVKAIPGARKIVIGGASHMGPLEKPDVYVRLANDFLSAP